MLFVSQIDKKHFAVPLGDKPSIPHSPVAALLSQIPARSGRRPAVLHLGFPFYSIAMSVCLSFLFLPKVIFCFIVKCSIC